MAQKQDKQKTCLINNIVYLPVKPTCIELCMVLCYAAGCVPGTNHFMKGGCMAKRVFLVLLAVSLGAALGTAPARAAQHQEVLGNILRSLEADLQAADPTGELDPLTVNTLILIDRVHEALIAGDSARLQAILSDYAAAVAPMQDQQLNLTCSLPLLMSLFGSTTTMLTTIASGADQACMFIKLTNSIADIISAVQTYKICVIDSSETPDQTAREEIVRRQVVVKTYNFITSALYAGLCIESPTFFDWLSVFFDFIGIFPKQQPETTAP